MEGVQTGVTQLGARRAHPMGAVAQLFQVLSLMAVPAVILLTIRT